MTLKLMQTFSDKSTIVGCVREGNEKEYRSLINSPVVWCQHSNHLQLNTCKTKEIVVDYKKQKTYKVRKISIFYNSVMFM